MLVKLAVRNVRRSVRDYAVYFVTLVFGVAVFYAFNSIHGQSLLFDLEGASIGSIFDTTTNLINMFSVVIACVLGFLVVYANRFLIRRRRREFGTYLLLGMRPGQVGAIVLVETLSVGVASLAVGLVAGIALSQGLSFLTAALFSMDMSHYRFVFSSEALGMTLACFAVMFSVTALLNVASVRRMKLIALLQARQASESMRIRSPWASLVGFLASVAILALAYAVLIRNGMVDIDGEFALATALMLVGTFLFFWSVAGFVLLALQRTRGVYFRGLAMFTMRQIASKVNTAFVSLSVVCVMLFLALATLGTGTGLVKSFTGSLEDSTRFDATVSSNLYLLNSLSEVDGSARGGSGLGPRAQGLVDYAAGYGWDMERRLREVAPEWDSAVKSSTQVDVYQPGYLSGKPVSGTETYGEALARLGVSPSSESVAETLSGQSLIVVGESQFNAVRAALGEAPVSLGESGYAVNNRIDSLDGAARALADSGAQVSVGGVRLTSTGVLLAQPLCTSYVVGDVLQLVVPDSVIEAIAASGEVPYASYLNVEYADGAGKDAADAFLESLGERSVSLANGAYGYEASDGSGLIAPSIWPVTLISTATGVVEQSLGLRMMVSYLAIYLGFVFLIVTAALLAIQQLSETSDSLGRYRVLAELGCDRRMILRSMRTQVAVYFLAPLALAACHTVCAVGVLCDTLFAALGTSVSGPVALSVAATAVVYGIYLAVTYFACRGIVKGALGRKLLA